MSEVSKGLGRNLIIRAPAKIAKGFAPPQPAITDVPTGGSATAAANAAAVNAILAALRAQGIILP